MKNIKSILKINDKIIIILAFLIIIYLVLTFSKFDNSYIKEGKLYINEIMPKNTYTIKDNYGEYSDYIELYNGYNYSINLNGYHLSDSEYKTDKWTFPDIEIKPNEYFIIYASGRNNCDESKKICHTNFKLSSKGEVITLSDNHGNIFSKINYNVLSNDLAYGFVNNKYDILDKPSPFLENGEKLKKVNINNKDLYINEYMSNNKRMFYDSQGIYNDFVELYNASNDNLLLHNIYLSDDLNNLRKYKIPDITIKKNDYLLILLSDNSRIIDNQIYANFKLREEDKNLIISDGEKVIENIELVNLIDNVSYGRKNDKWYYFTKPTPGNINNTFGLEKIE